MTSLNAGLVISLANPRDDLQSIQEAERLGVPTVWSTVGGANVDAVSVFTAAAAVTDSIVFGTSIVPTYPRHPVVLASQALALEGLAPGRLRLGIGPSHRPTIEGGFGISMGKPLAHLREYLTVLRSLLWTGKVDFHGEYYQVEMELPPALSPVRTPIPISALGVNAFRLAGEVADGAISWIAPVPYLVSTALPALADGAQRGGRDMPPLIGHVPVALSSDREAVRDAGARMFGSYGRLPFYANMFNAAGFPVENGRLSTAAIDEIVVSGSPDEVRARLERIHDEGIGELLISHVPIRNVHDERHELSRIIAR